MDARTSTYGRRAGAAGGRRRVGATVAVAAVAAVWSGCSVEKHYSVLSFFFDGVPDPNAPPANAMERLLAMRRSPTYVTHKPFADEACAECHTERFDLRGIGPEVCSKCHQGKRDEHSFMHGPVAAGACLMCHTPHESAHAFLLKDESRTVCTQCHSTAFLGTERVPEHGDPQRGCLECHSGHGGPEPYFLHGPAAMEGAGGRTPGAAAGT